MNWSGSAEFFAMGGYALYVWGSYSITLALMIAEILVLRARRRAVLERLRASSPGRASG